MGTENPWKFSKDCSNLLIFQNALNFACFWPKMIENIINCYIYFHFSILDQKQAKYRAFGKISKFKLSMLNFQVFVKEMLTKNLVLGLMAFSFTQKYSKSIAIHVFWPSNTEKAQYLSSKRAYLDSFVLSSAKMQKMTLFRKSVHNWSFWEKSKNFLNIQKVRFLGIYCKKMSWF